jgi:hypothetical protein
MADQRIDDFLVWNPLIFKDPWVELSALVQNSPDDRRQVVGAALELQKEILNAQLKAINTLQSIAAKSQGRP